MMEPSTPAFGKMLEGKVSVNIIYQRAIVMLVAISRT